MSINFTHIFKLMQFPWSCLYILFVEHPNPFNPGLIWWIEEQNTMIGVASKIQLAMSF